MLPGRSLIRVHDPILGWWDITDNTAAGLRSPEPHDWWGVPTELSMSRDGAWSVSMAEWSSLFARSLMASPYSSTADYAAVNFQDAIVEFRTARVRPATINTNRWGVPAYGMWQDVSAFVLNGVAVNAWSQGPKIPTRAIEKWWSVADYIAYVVQASGGELGLHARPGDGGCLRPEFHYPRLGYASSVAPIALSDAEFTADQVVYRQPTATRVIGAGADAWSVYPPVTTESVATAAVRTDVQVSLLETSSAPLAVQVQKQQQQLSRAKTRVSGQLDPLTAHRIQLGDTITLAHIDTGTFRVVAHQRTVGRDPQATLELEQQ